MILNAALFATSLLLWMASCGVRRSDEVRAGAVGLLVILLLWGCWAGLFELADNQQLVWLEQIVAISISTAPGAAGFLQQIEARDTPFSVLIFLAAVAHLALLYRYLTKFGESQQITKNATDAKQETNSDWLGAPCRSKASAIIWKQVHETGPLALVAFVAVLAMALIGYWASYREDAFRLDFSQILSSITVSAAFLGVIVAGIGVFLEDMKHRSEHFGGRDRFNSSNGFG